MMKVNQSADQLLQVQQQPAKKEATKEADAKGVTVLARQSSTTVEQGGVVSSVSVTLSASVRALEQAGISPTDENIDWDKVRQVRAAIENGTYVVNADTIAEKLLASSAELIAPPAN
jgi:negative regulator of flagellin synthesis FlgM